MIKVTKLTVLKITLTLISIASPSLILNEISDEQMAHIYNICTDLKDHTDAKYIIIKAAGASSHKYDIALLLHKIPEKTKNTHSTNISDGALFPKSIKKSNYIAQPQLNIFSENNGKRIMKLSCKDIKYFRKKVGPFLIPSTTHLVREPKIELFNHENN